MPQPNNSDKTLALAVFPSDHIVSFQAPTKRDSLDDFFPIVKVLEKTIVMVKTRLLLTAMLPSFLRFFPTSLVDELF